MYIDESGKIVQSNAAEITIERQDEYDAKVHFMKNPYPVELLKEYLQMAKDNGSLDIAKASKKRQLSGNPIINYDLQELLDKNLLDKTRLDALDLIEKFIGEDRSE